MGEGGSRGGEERDMREGERRRRRDLYSRVHEKRREGGGERRGWTGRARRDERRESTRGSRSLSLPPSLPPSLLSPSTLLPSLPPSLSLPERARGGSLLVMTVVGQRSHALPLYIYRRRWGRGRGEGGRPTLRRKLPRHEKKLRPADASYGKRRRRREGE